jgi:hypothetical protein
MTYDVIAVTCFADLHADGFGPLPRSLYVGGFFGVSAGGTVTGCVMKRDGFEWSHVGGGIGGSVTENVCGLQVLDPVGDGPQPPALDAGGTFQTAGVPRRRVRGRNTGAGGGGE